MIGDTVSNRPVDLEAEFAKAKTSLVLAKLLHSLVLTLILTLIIFWSQANIHCWSVWPTSVKFILVLVIFISYVTAKVFGRTEADFCDDLEGLVPNLDELKFWLKRKLHSNWYRVINLSLIVAIAYFGYTIQTDFCIGQKKSRDEMVLYSVTTIQRALADYKSANGVYPPKEAILTNAPIRDNNTVYLDKVPWPPVGMTLECMKFNEYFYNPVGDDYEIKYCLDEAYKDIPRGAHVAGQNDVVWSEAR